MAKTYKKRKGVRKSRRVRRVKRGGNQDITKGFTPAGFTETIQHYLGYK
jgi:hypothetical protein